MPMKPRPQSLIGAVVADRARARLLDDSDVDRLVAAAGRSELTPDDEDEDDEDEK